MKISVIGASRGRPELFIKSIDSLINQAHNMDDVETINMDGSRFNNK